MTPLPKITPRRRVELPVVYHDLDWLERRNVREEYVRLQGGICAHCGEALTGVPALRVSAKKINAALFPRSFFSHPVHLHHSHRTGLTIGAVHNYCNAVLWQYHRE